MIRVLIERWLIKDLDTFAHDAFRDIRQQATARPGYVSGETLRDADDPNHYIVISSWQSREHWDAWYGSEQRRQADEPFRAAMATSEKITVWELA